ncbi:class I SAM-dependent methyltransferase [Streptomyces sp. SID13666]|uniref:class I SAM-dependent methyltransferase n=1 Tax=unclassified Streptomyces TaxID=2593676 RepID=UPI0013C153C2|nr:MULTISPECIES: class I SAM-dependent methyltransferase [unclassified Streptomyces]NEA59295.1 class I SAM-dependent methyltransferase [Streptomyces sp. SID13666]NEA76669.1 class I SAM-dependent methyltransferase [Streptomyces sp. SID13588]
MTVTPAAPTAPAVRTADWQSWQKSWDRQQEWYLPDREERFRVMLDMVEALVGPAPKVLDLACGTGSISDRVLRRFPEARSTGVDLDPALLTIARGHFEGESRIEFVTADLRDPRWTDRLPHREYDAVLTATALHWLRTDPLRELYGRVAGVLRPGGVFMNADHAPDESTPRINEAERALRHARMAREKADGVLDWTEWWDLARQDELLAGPVAARYEIFGSHADGEPHSVEWHAQALRDAGFAEARAVWRSVPDALVLGLK